MRPELGRIYDRLFLTEYLETIPNPFTFFEI